MAKAMPHHLYSGLVGGYLPNIAEHYDSKTEALEAMRDLVDHMDFDGTLKTYGAIRDGFVGIGEWEYVNIEPCNHSAEECELENYE